MAYSSRNSENPTISQLVQPSQERRNPDNPYSVRDRYTDDSRRPGGINYESTRRTGDHQYTETDRRNNDPGYTQRVPTTNVLIDPYRRPAHGNARTCVMEVNISVGLGADRAPHASVSTNNYSSKTPAIRSTAFLEDARYVDLTFQVPEHTARIATDGIIRQSSPREATGFTNKQ